MPFFSSLSSFGYLLWIISLLIFLLYTSSPTMAEVLNEKMEKLRSFKKSRNDVLNHNLMIKTIIDNIYGEWSTQWEMPVLMSTEGGHMNIDDKNGSKNIKKKINRYYTILVNGNISVQEKNSNKNFDNENNEDKDSLVLKWSQDVIIPKKLVEKAAKNRESSIETEKNMNKSTKKKINKRKRKLHISQSLTSYKKIISVDGDIKKKINIKKNKMLQFKVLSPFRSVTRLLNNFSLKGVVDNNILVNNDNDKNNNNNNNKDGGDKDTRDDYEYGFMLCSSTSLPSGSSSNNNIKDTIFGSKEDTIEINNVKDLSDFGQLNNNRPLLSLSSSIPTSPHFTREGHDFTRHRNIYYQRMLQFIDDNIDDTEEEEESFDVMLDQIYSARLGNKLAKEKKTSVVDAKEDVNSGVDNKDVINNIDSNNATEDQDESAVDDNEYRLDVSDLVELLLNKRRENFVKNALFNNKKNKNNLPLWTTKIDHITEIVVYKGVVFKVDNNDKEVGSSDKADWCHISKYQGFNNNGIIGFITITTVGSPVSALVKTGVKSGIINNINNGNNNNDVDINKERMLSEMIVKEVTHRGRGLDSITFDVVMFNDIISNNDNKNMNREEGDDKDEDLPLTQRHRIHWGRVYGSSDAYYKEMVKNAKKKKAIRKKHHCGESDVFNNIKIENINNKQVRHGYSDNNHQEEEENDEELEPSLVDQILSSPRAVILVVAVFFIIIRMYIAYRLTSNRLMIRKEIRLGMVKAGAEVKEKVHENIKRIITATGSDN